MLVGLPLDFKSHETLVLIKNVYIETEFMSDCSKILAVVNRKVSFEQFSSFIFFF